jgi:hypothetical protein
VVRNVTSFAVGCFVPCSFVDSYLTQFSIWFCSGLCVVQVRWGNPGVKCLFSVLGTLPDPTPKFQIIPWTDVEVTAAVQPDSSLSLTLQYFIGDFQSDKRTVLASLGQQRCIQLPSASGNGDLLLCVTDVDATSKYQNNAADMTLEVVLNVTWPASGPQTVYSRAFVSDFIDCRLRVREMALLCVSLFLCLFLPVLFFFKCPPPVAHRVEPPRLHASLADLEAPSRLAKFLVKLRKAALDSNMWGSFMYLAASAMYVHARVSPDYLDAHPEYRNHLYIWAAALYLWSAVFYHVAWEQSPVVPTLAELFETYLNILGSSGFVASAVMYLWGGFQVPRQAHVPSGVCLLHPLVVGRGVQRLGFGGVVFIVHESGAFSHSEGLHERHLFRPHVVLLLGKHVQLCGVDAVCGRVRLVDGQNS